MKSFITISLILILAGCGAPLGISSMDKETIELHYGPIQKIKIQLIETDGSLLEVSDHPFESFNGSYKSQSGKINNKFWYKNENNRYLYHYNQAQGGEKSWSLDHRKPDGNRDQFSGGWTRNTDGLYPEGGENDWFSIDQVMIDVVSEGDLETVKMFLDDNANINTKLQISDSPIIFITPLDVAIGEGHEKVAELLRKNGAKTWDDLKTPKN